MPTDRPTVSVVMATYNGEKYLREQIDSILAQSYPIHELIIEDDRSTDGTVEIAKEYAARFPNVHVYENTHNLGFNLNFKTAAMRATGDFVALSDQDDVWFPEKIKELIAAIGGHDISFSAHLRGTDIARAHVVSPQYSPEALLFQGFAGHTMLLRREFIQDDRNWLDYIIYDWGLAISAQLDRGHGIVFVETPLNWHRSNDNSACATMERKYGKNTKGKPTYEPYLHGWRNYRRLQQQENFRRLYQYIHEQTSRKESLKTVHKMARLMLSGSACSLLKLCIICMKHRKTIYPKGGNGGIMGLVRGFFYPFIFSYNNYMYRMEFNPKP